MSLNDTHACFTLKTGREVQLVELRQSKTYGGLLEGQPTIERDERYLRLLSHGSNGLEGIARTIVPPRETVDYLPLPTITSIGLFVSYDPARNHAFDCSQLVVVWFQDDFGIADDGILNNLLTNIDWNSLATDCNY